MARRVMPVHDYTPNSSGYVRPNSKTQNEFNLRRTPLALVNWSAEFTTRQQAKDRDLRSMLTRFLRAGFGLVVAVWLDGHDMDGV